MQTDAVSYSKRTRDSFKSSAGATLISASAAAHRVLVEGVAAVVLRAVWQLTSVGHS